jgi:branched-chain amino acid transport system substrate-binding protein
LDQPERAECRCEPARGHGRLEHPSLEVGCAERAVGLYSAQVFKTPADPQWESDPGFKDWLAFMRKYLAGADINDAYHIAGYNSAQLLVQALKQCGDELTRENLMRQAINISDFQPSMSLPGITVNTSPTNYDVFHMARLSRFDGKSWVLFGDLIGY